MKETPATTAGDEVQICIVILKSLRLRCRDKKKEKGLVLRKLTYKRTSGEAGPTGIEPATPGLKVHNSLKIEWRLIRADFTVYLDSKRLNQAYVDDMLHYLNQYLTIINSPIDIMRTFTKVKQGQRHLWAGLRNIFNFLEVMGYDSEALNAYRKALPKLVCGVDLKVPEEPRITQSLNRLHEISAPYAALYNLLVDSGLRLVEAIKVASEFDSVEHINGFYRVALGQFRGSKQAYYAYLTEPTYNQILAGKSDLLNIKSSWRYSRRRGLIRPKYLRKFAFDTMVSLEIPESVADFIEGRVPKRIGAKHYMVLRRQADKFYSKYNDYLTKLRQQIHIQ